MFTGSQNSQDATLQRKSPVAQESKDKVDGEDKDEKPEKEEEEEAAAVAVVVEEGAVARRTR